MGFSRFSLLLLLVILAGVVAVIALPGGSPSGKRAAVNLPWEPFCMAGGAFTPPEGWSSIDPYRPRALGLSGNRCAHRPPARSQAALLRSADREVSVWLAAGPAKVMRAVFTANAVRSDDGERNPAGFRFSPAGPPGLNLRWQAATPPDINPPCAFGIAESGQFALLVHVSGRPNEEALRALSTLLRSVRVPLD